MLMDWENIVKMCILLQVIYRVNVLPIKFPTAFFRNRKKNPRIPCMQPQKILNSQGNLEK